LWLKGFEPLDYVIPLHIGVSLCRNFQQRGRCSVLIICFSLDRRVRRGARFKYRTNVSVVLFHPHAGHGFGFSQISPSVDDGPNTPFVIDNPDVAIPTKAAFDSGASGSQYCELCEEW